MFEKEAEEYAEKHIFYDEYTERHRYDKPITEIFKDGAEAFKDGAEFGYNKVNEWHYPSKGEYPEDYEDILICFLTENDMRDCVWGWCEYYAEDNKYIFKYVDILGTQYPKTVIAWKKLVLPTMENI